MSTSDSSSWETESDYSDTKQAPPRLDAQEQDSKTVEQAMNARRCFNCGRFEVVSLCETCFEGEGMAKLCSLCDEVVRVCVCVWSRLLWYQYRK
jgi:hypothetical protein